MKPRTASAGTRAAAEVVVIFVEVVAAGVGGVGLPVVGGPAVAAIAVEGEHRRGIGLAEVEIEAVDVGRDGLGVGGIDGDRDVHRSVGRRGAGLSGIGAFTDSVQRGDDIEVGGAVGEPGVGEACGGRRGDLRVRAARCGAALEVIAGGAGTCGPAERDLGVTSCRDQTGGRGGRLRRSNGRGAGLGGVRTFAGGVDRGDDVEVGGAVGEVGVGEIRGGWGGDFGVRTAGGGAALYVVACGARAGGPSEANLRIGGGGHESCWRCGSLRRRGRLGADFGGVRAFSRGIDGGHNVEIGGSVGQAGVGEARRGG